MNIELPQLDAQLPLLDDNGHVVAGQTRRTASNRSGKHTEWTSIAISGRALGVLLGCLAIAVVGAGTIGSYYGFAAYGRLAFPHRHVDASLAEAQDGHDVVEPYLAPMASGVTSKVELAMTI